MRRVHLLKVWSVVLLLLIGSGGRAQSTLADYLATARQSSPQLTDYQNQSRLAELEIARIRAGYDKPRVSVTGDVVFAPYLFNNRRLFSVSDAPAQTAVGYDVGVTNGGLYAALLNVDYQLFSNRLSTPLVQQQLLAQRTADNQLRVNQLDLQRQVTLDYLTALQLQEQIRYNRAIVDRLTEQHELVRRLADRGVMRITDLQLLNLEIGKQGYLIADLALQYRQALQTLRATVGSSDTTQVELSMPQMELALAVPSSVFSETYRLDSLNAANDQLRFETQYLPQVSAFANGGLNAVTVQNIQRKLGVSAGVHLSWVLYDGGQRNLNAQQNEIRRQTAARYAEFTRQQLENYRTNGAALLQTFTANQALLDRQLQDYDRVLNTYRKEFAMGQVSVVDYLTVIRSLADLQQQRNQLTVQRLLTINEINYWNH